MGFKRIKTPRQVRPRKIIRTKVTFAFEKESTTQTRHNQFNTNMNKNRVTSKPPKFFRRLRNFAIGVVATAASVTASPVAPPPEVQKVVNIVLAVAAGVAATSQLTKPQDSED